MAKINFVHVIQHLTRISTDVTTLVADVQQAQSDPAIQAELKNCPQASALLADVSQRLRDLQEAVS